jgi:trehalose-6-phosphate synthase
VEQAFKNIKDKRLAQASQVVATLLNDMTTQLTQKSADATISSADLMRSVKASLADYVSQAEGPTKWPKLVEHLQTVLAVIVKRVEGDAARGVEAAQRAATDLKAQLATAQGEVARLRAAAGSEESKARALEQQLEAAHQKAASDAALVRTQLQVDHFWFFFHLVLAVAI